MKYVAFDLSRSSVWLNHNSGQQHEPFTAFFLMPGISKTEPESNNSASGKERLHYNQNKFSNDTGRHVSPSDLVYKSQKFAKSFCVIKSCRARSQSHHATTHRHKKTATVPQFPPTWRGFCIISPMLRSLKIFRPSFFVCLLWHVM